MRRDPGALPGAGTDLFEARHSPVTLHQILRRVTGSADSTGTVSRDTSMGRGIGLGLQTQKLSGKCQSTTFLVVRGRLWLSPPQAATTSSNLRFRLGT